MAPAWQLDLSGSRLVLGSAAAVILPLEGLRDWEAEEEEGMGWGRTGDARRTAIVAGLLRV